MRLRLDGDVAYGAVPKWVKRAKHTTILEVQPRPNPKTDVVVTIASIFNLLTTVHGNMASSDGPLAPAPTVPGV